MDDFQNAAQRFMQKMAEKDCEHYTPAWNVARCGMCFPLQQHMRIRSRHAVFGINCGLGKMGVGEEYCYFLAVESLGGKELETAFSLIARLAEEDTDCCDREHDFTFISLVLLTPHFSDPILKKEVRRFRMMRCFSCAAGQYGWYACRLCVVALSEGTIVSSALGQPLKDRLLADQAMPAKRKCVFFFNRN